MTPEELKKQSAQGLDVLRGINPDLARRTQAALSIDPNAPITSSALSPTTSPVVTPTVPSIVPDISKLPEIKIPKVEESDPLGGLEDLERRISGFDPESRVKVQTAEQQRALNEINKRIGLLQARTEAIPLELQKEFEGRGVTKGGIEPLERGRQRDAAIEAMELSALAQAAQGDLLLARDLAKDAVKTQFEQLESDAARKRANIIDNFDSFTPEQKRRAEETLRKLDAGDLFLKDERA